MSFSPKTGCLIDVSEQPQMYVNGYCFTQDRYYVLVSDRYSNKNHVLYIDDKGELLPEIGQENERSVLKEQLLSLKTLYPAGQDFCNDMQRRLISDIIATQNVTRSNNTQPHSPQLLEPANNYSDDVSEKKIEIDRFSKQYLYPKVGLDPETGRICINYLNNNKHPAVAEKISLSGTEDVIKEWTRIRDRVGDVSNIDISNFSEAANLRLTFENAVDNFGNWQEMFDYGNKVEHSLQELKITPDLVKSCLEVINTFKGISAGVGGTIATTHAGELVEIDLNSMNILKDFVTLVNSIADDKDRNGLPYLQSPLLDNPMFLTYHALLQMNDLCVQAMIQQGYKLEDGLAKEPDRTEPDVIRKIRVALGIEKVTDPSFDFQT